MSIPRVKATTPGITTVGFLATAILATIWPAVSARGASIVFAGFSVPSGQPSFSFTDNVVTGTISAVDIPVAFRFTTATGLDTTDHAAFLSISGVNGFSTATPTAGATVLDQPIDQLEKLTITSGTGGTGTNFLTMLFTGDLTGVSGGNQGDLSDSDNALVPRTVSYTSDFGKFSTPGSGYNLALSNISPGLSIGAGGFLNSFRSDISGTFTGNFQPVAVAPEPGSVALLATGIAGILIVRRRMSQPGRRPIHRRK
jgi:hypothetical protein